MKKKGEKVKEIRKEKLTINDFLKNKLTSNERILKPKKIEVELKRLNGLIEIEEIDYFYQVRMIEDMERTKNNPNSLYIDSLKIVCDKLVNPNLCDLDMQMKFGVYSSKELAEILFTEKEILDIADILIKRSMRDKSVEMQLGLEN